MTSSMKPCKFTSRSSISERLLDNNKTTAKIQSTISRICVLFQRF